MALIALAGVIFSLSLHRARSTAPAGTPASNAPAVQAQVQAGAGFPIPPGHLAPQFSLIDQFGRKVALSSLRGHEVVLAFIDSRCTTICPLTSAILSRAHAQLGPSEGKEVTLLALNANPVANSVADVYRWSAEHLMLHEWLFLTGSSSQLEALYHRYAVYVHVEADGTVVHDPAVYIIGAGGHERLYFQTLMSKRASTMTSETEALVAGMRQCLPRAG